MNFYPKKINTIEELKLEKQKLLAASEQADIKHMLSLDALKGSEEPPKEKDTPPEDSSLIKKLLFESSFEEIAIEYVMPLLQKAGIKIGSAGKEAGKKLLKTAAKEIIGGYLKWKAIELSFQGLSYLIQSRKKKRNKDT